MNEPSIGPAEVLTFWFADAADSPQAAQQRNAFWYGSGKLLDNEITQRFGATLQRAVNGDLDHWADTAEGRLALIIVLDQFSRHIHRGQREAFAADPIAQQHCLQGMQGGRDRQLAIVHRAFFYMPLEHAESASLQQQSKTAFAQLLSEAPPAWQSFAEGAQKWAVEHAQIIDRFGRFPHRNDILGRVSTTEEIDYMNAGANRYGQ